MTEDFNPLSGYKNSVFDGFNKGYSIVKQYCIVLSGSDMNKKDKELHHAAPYPNN